MEQTVLIMMATYNGEKYLAKQLDSILKQTHKNWTLAIQDDGSTDKTMEIIKQYVAKENRIVFFENHSSHHGAYYNFHTLANRYKKDSETFNYYMFCDQDDIWDTDKIERMVAFVSQFENDTPALAHADRRLCDGNDVVTDQSLNALYGISGRDKFNTFFSHKVAGCNLIMNRAAFFSVPILDLEQIPEYLSHDNLYAKTVACLGEIGYLPESTMCYRRHGENVTNEQQFKAGFSRIIKRMFGLNGLAKDHAKTYNQSLYAISLFEQMSLPEETQNHIAKIKEAIYKGGVTSLRFMRKNRVHTGRKIEDISRRLILFLGLYKKYLEF